MRGGTPAPACRIAIARVGAARGRVPNGRSGRAQDGRLAVADEQGGGRSSCSWRGSCSQRRARVGPPREARLESPSRRPLRKAASIKGFGSAVGFAVLTRVSARLAAMGVSGDHGPTPAEKRAPGPAGARSSGAGTPKQPDRPECRFSPERLWAGANRRDGTLVVDSRSQWNGGYGADTGPSRGDPPFASFQAQREHDRPALIPRPFSPARLSLAQCNLAILPLTVTMYPGSDRTTARARIRRRHLSSQERICVRRQSAAD
jgi:hypothetical protein